MVIQNLYETGDRGIVSVGYTDVATGKSRTNLYGGITYSGYASGASITATGLSGVGVLSNVPFYSDVIWTGTQINNLTYRKSFDLDFELPQTIDGQTVVQIPIFVDSAGAGNHNYWLEIDIQKIDSSNNVSSILSGATRSYIGLSNDSSGAHVFSWSGDFPRTTFKSGEKLRLLLYPRADGTGQQYYIGTDPEGRTTISRSGGKDTVSTISSKLIFQVPFKVDL